MLRIKQFIIVFHLSCLSLYGQSTFYELGKKQIPRVDSLYLLITEKATSQPFDYFSDSTQQINHHFNSLLLKFNRNKMETLQQSKALTNITEFCSRKARSLLSSNFKSREAKKKRIKQILNNCKKPYGLISIHTFSIPLLKQKRHYFYDKNGPEGGFNLYLGSKPSEKEVEEGFKYIPLETYTYTEITELLIRKIQSSAISKELSRRRTCAVGHHFFLDEKTVKRKRIPQLSCIVILGHKRIPKQKKQ